MKIIIPGDADRLKKVKRFSCPYCGCVFEAEQGEYKRTSWRNEDYYIHPCPTCGKEVTA